jgi:hypothetical protein
MKNLPALIHATCRSTAFMSEAATIRKRLVSVSLLSAAAVALSAGRLVADPLPPTSFPAGTTQYQILFETSGITDATNTDISAYNSFVQSQVTPALAALDPVADWRAVAATGNGSPSTNAPSVAGIPVYTTTGQLLTDSGLYAGSSGYYSGLAGNTLDTTPNITQTGSFNSNNTAWTFDLGSDHAFAGVGDAFVTGPDWLTFRLDVPSMQRSMYALSGPIDVPNSTPEPASIALLGTGLLAVGTVRGWRRRAIVKRQSANSAAL